MATRTEGQAGGTGGVAPRQAAVSRDAPRRPEVERERAGVFRQLGIDTVYTVFTGLPLAVVGFSLCITFVVLGIGTLVTFIGIPILAGAFYLTRGFADLHRWNLRSVLRRHVTRPHYLRAPAGSGFVRRMVTPLRDPQSWLDFASVIIDLPLSVFAFAIGVAWWSGAIAGVTSATYEWAIPYGPDNHSLVYLMGLKETYANRALVQTGIGLILLLTLIPVMRMVALVRAYPALGLLAGVAEMRDEIVGLQERNAGLSDQKQAAVSAESSALRRIERDIHDGPQQRLVRVAMDLGRARQQLDNDPEAARATRSSVRRARRWTSSERCRVASRRRC
jgi:signal transduction histidine kinase